MNLRSESNPMISKIIELTLSGFSQIHKKNTSVPLWMGTVNSTSKLIAAHLPAAVKPPIVLNMSSNLPLPAAPVDPSRYI